MIGLDMPDKLAFMAAKTFTVRLDESLCSDLEALASFTNQSEAQLIREIIAKSVNERSKEVSAGFDAMLAKINSRRVNRGPHGSTPTAMPRLPGAPQSDPVPTPSQTPPSSPDAVSEALRNFRHPPQKPFQSPEPGDPIEP